MNRFLKGIAVVVSALSATSALAADLSVPTHSSIQVKEDPALNKLLPADIAKRGYIVAATNPNTPPTTFLKLTIKLWQGAKSM